jgi:hypothetical protein
MKSVVTGLGLAVSMVLAGCSGDAGAEGVDHADEALTANPALCMDLLGAWSATISNVTATLPVVGTVSVSGSLTFDLSAGSTPDEAIVNGNASITVPGQAPINQPIMLTLPGFDASCTGRFHVESSPTLPVVGAVHFVIDGPLVSGPPLSSTTTVRLDTAPGALLPISASGTLVFTKR